MYIVGKFEQKLEILIAQINSVGGFITKINKIRIKQ